MDESCLCVEMNVVKIDTAVFYLSIPDFILVQACFRDGIDNAVADAEHPAASIGPDRIGFEVLQLMIGEQKQMAPGASVCGQAAYEGLVLCPGNAPYMIPVSCEYAVIERSDIDFTAVSWLIEIGDVPVVHRLHGVCPAVSEVDGQQIVLYAEQYSLP